MLSIGALAARAGVTTRALRYYGEQGLLPASRTVGGQRRYPENAIKRVRTIQELFAAGLSSRTIAVLLPCVDSHSISDETVDMLFAERARIEQQIRDLHTSLHHLDEVIVIATVPGACRD